MKLNIIKAVLGAAPNIKKWLWADGSFRLDRALVLLVGMVVLAVGYHFLGAEGLEVVLGYLEELSDIIGYVE